MLNAERDFVNILYRLPIMPRQSVLTVHIAINSLIDSRPLDQYYITEISTNCLSGRDCPVNNKSFPVLLLITLITLISCLVQSS